MTPQEKETLREMWMDDVPREQIAAALGISASGVTGRVRRMGLPMRTHKPRGGIAPVVFSPEQEEEFRTSWNNGVPTSTLAVDFGIASSTVSKMARRLNLEPRYKNRKRLENESPTVLTGGRWVKRGKTMRWVEDPPQAG